MQLQLECQFQTIFSVRGYTPLHTSHLLASDARDHPSHLLFSTTRTNTAYNRRKSTVVHCVTVMQLSALFHYRFKRENILFPQILSCIAFFVPLIEWLRGIWLCISIFCFNFFFSSFSFFLALFMVTCVRPSWHHVVSCSVVTLHSLYWSPGEQRSWPEAGHVDLLLTMNCPVISSE